MGKSFADYHLAADTSAVVHYDQLTKEIECERSIEVLVEDLLMPFKLNVEQRHAYDLILQSVFSPLGQSFFIDGPGGTGKTFLYRSLLATLRSQGHIAIVVATSGVAAFILPGGRTAHSRLILWDEASMAKLETVEAFDDLLRDIMDRDLPFGGKNIRAILDPAFSEFLLRIGEGRETVNRHGEITLSSEMVIPYTEKEESLNGLLKSVFSNLMTYSKDPYSMINRCVFAPKNSSVDEINDVMIKRFPGNLHVYVSSDRTVDPRHQGDYEDFLNSQNPKALKVLIVPGTFDGIKVDCKTRNVVFEEILQLTEH
ncbi:uncharacterized protein [Coffea arabica]|uniref:ATP-dependent DNA helicase n=1 Tax=Coffea arabica TaxID=13443 RepID=A0A6P6WYG0_COFAR|nr:ATP-dependent DNA helicase PIF2-like [Coffea arabica]